MAGALEQIRDWARSLKYWEQATLEKIVVGAKLGEEDYGELISLWEQDAGLADSPSPRPRLNFPSESTPESNRPKTRLVRLYNLTNVNALPQQQELPFSSQVTLIFGANGTGKTGYARPLGCAAFSRGEKEVLPNVERQNQTIAPSADIEVLVDGRQEHIQLHWQSGQRCPELSRFYVFDAESLNVHLLEANAMNVTPSALGLLTKLADVTDEVRHRIQSEIGQRCAPHTFAAHFHGGSTVSRLIDNLGPTTDIEHLRKLSTLATSEEDELKQLATKVDQLRLQSNAQLLNTKRQELTDIEALLRRDQEAAKATDAPSVDVAQKLIEKLQEAQRLAEQFGAQQFACEPFSQVGTDIWRRFITAARQLAEAEERASGTAYPQDGSPCLLCQQPLSGQAVDLFNRLWQFLSSDAQKRFADAQRACDDRIRELESVPVNYFGQDSSIRRLLESKLPNIVSAIEAHAESSAARIEELAEALRKGQAQPLPPLVTFDSTDLLRLVSIVKAEIRDLEDSKEGESLTRFEAALRELQHRKVLGVYLAAIEEYVRGRRWASKATAELGSTVHITRQYNELFDSLVTEKYKSTFQSILKRFGRNLRVSVETRGRKGQTVRQIRLAGDDFPSNPPIAKILSEGEKRAVALADFLAEAETDDSCDGLILDDPVTSFDASWKRELAAYLTDRAGAGQQVVVFTHDLAFLYDIHKSASDTALEVSTHWVQKRNDKPGYLFVNNSPACESDFKSAKYAEDCYHKSRDLPPVEQQNLLGQGFGSLRTSYEALVVFGLFNGVVQRFEERLRLDLLMKVNFDNDLARQITSRWAQLSRYIDAHLHSDQYASEKPTPETLQTEINMFKDLRKRVEELKKAADASSAKNP